MNKGTLFLLFFIVLLGGGVAAGALLGGRTEHVVPTLKATGSSLAAKEETIPVNLVVGGVEHEMSVAPGNSVYDVMVQAHKTSGLSFRGSEFSGLGFFVEEINGLRQNPRAGQYWIYYINGRKAEVGISVYIVQEHDVISWKYEDEE